MHAQQSFFNVYNTAILGYHGDKIILYKNVKNIKCHKLQVIKLSNMSRSQIIYKITDYYDEEGFKPSILNPICIN
jgi:hypothetical protein